MDISPSAIKYLLENAWCAPDQDTQHIVKPPRITPIGGARTRVEIMRQRLMLPDSINLFHVYHIGHIPTKLLALLDIRGQWENMADVCQRNDLVVNFHNASGIELPKNACYYYVTKNQSLVVAVALNRTIPFNLDSEDLYFRIYANAYFDRVASAPGIHGIKVISKTINKLDDIPPLQSQMAQWKNLNSGYAYIVKNGMLVDNISILNTAVGDTVDICYDSSVREVHDLLVTSLPQFKSLLDTQMKYLVHRAGDIGTTIDYHDDIDFYICTKNATDGTTGVYYHRNRPSAARMVTHRDYALAIPFVNAYLNARGWNDGREVYVRMVIRNSGFDRPLIFENQRIKELYKLKEIDRVRAMMSIDAVIPNWVAPNLEQSPYALFLGRASRIFDKQIVEDVLGYNALSKLIGDSPISAPVIPGTELNPKRRIALPVGLQNRSTVICYDSNGNYLGYEPHSLNENHYPADSRTDIAEVLFGLPSESISEVYGQGLQLLDPTIDYRFYLCAKNNGVPDYKWTDVTNTGVYSLTADGTRLTWLVDSTQYLTLVRDNTSVLVNEFEIQSKSGVVFFTLTQKTTCDGIVKTIPMEIPMGELTVVINKKTLIEGLDYIVKFPTVVIISKEHLITPDLVDQKGFYYFTGFCKSDMTRELRRDVGFVRHNALSNNHIYNIRDDKVLKITLGGGVYQRERVVFPEGYTGIRNNAIKNGTPYEVRDVVVPIHGSAFSDTYALKTKANVIDDNISGYLTDHLPDDPEGMLVIESLYRLYSPFCCRLIHELASGVLNDPRMIGELPDDVVTDICRPFEYLLDFDPTQDTLRPNPKFVIVEPHNANTVMTLNYLSYRFLQRAVKLYLKDRVILSHFIEIT